MTLTVPDMVGGQPLTAEELKIDLACALYARGRIGRTAAVEFAGIDFFAFQKALGERGISSTSEQSLEDDLNTLDSLFPR